MKSSHGLARLSEDGKTLTITVQVKKGKRYVDKVDSYEVEKVDSDPRCAEPVIALKKTDGEVYHISFAEFGIRCDCPSGEIRERYGSTGCKHAKACVAVGLIPGGSHAVS